MSPTSALPVLVFDGLGGELAERLEALRAGAPREILATSGMTLLRDYVEPAVLTLDDPLHAGAWALLPEHADVSPEPVALVAVRELLVGPGARLRLDGRPTVMVAERLTIVAGGAVEVAVYARMFIDNLVKLDSTVRSI